MQLTKTQYKANRQSWGSVAAQTHDRRAWGAPPHNHELEETWGGIATQPNIFDEMWWAPPHNHEFEDEEM
jgi:hypothetical protein